MFKKIIIINSPLEININRIKHLKAEIVLREKSNISFGKKTSNLLKKNKIKYYAYNSLKKLNEYKTNNLYISSYNKKSYKHLKLHNKNIFIIGAAHSYTEVNKKINQGCDAIILSRLFKTKSKTGYLGIYRFLNILNNYKCKFLVLGGINQKTVKKLKLLKDRIYGVCVMSSYHDPNFFF